MNDIRLILFHPEQRSGDQYLNPRSQRRTLSNPKKEIQKHNRDGTIVVKEAIYLVVEVKIYRDYRYVI